MGTLRTLVVASLLSLVSDSPADRRRCAQFTSEGGTSWS